MADKKKIVRRGLQHHRLKDNPEEKRFAEAWDRLNDSDDHLAFILDVRGDAYRVTSPSAKASDHVLAATVIQWLGSPVGQSFLAGLGYTRGDGVDRVRRAFARIKEVALNTTTFDFAKTGRTDSSKPNISSAPRAEGICPECGDELREMPFGRCAVMHRCVGCGFELGPEKRK